MKTPPLHIIAKDADLRVWAARLEAADPRLPIAIDTESDSLHRYREKVCLVQMTALGEDVIIDPLALSSLAPLRGVLADKSRVKIFHDAGYDLVCLHRDFDLRVEGLFDTMLASRLLGLRQFGLASLLETRFGFVADKRLQRSDWSRRPLTPEQLSYARYDTHFLVQLMAQLEAELSACGRLAWAHEDFARLPEVIERVQARPQVPDADAFWRIAGARQLDPAAAGRLRALYQMRERLAERQDLPAFKVINDFVLMELATEPPASLAAIAPRPGLRQGGIGRYGRDIVGALARAEPMVGPPPRGVGRRRRTGRMLDPGPKTRYEALREARRKVAASLGIEPEVAVGNAVLEDLAKAPPESLAELKGRPELMGWRTTDVVPALWTQLIAPLSDLAKFAEPRRRTTAVVSFALPDDEDTTPDKAPLASASDKADVTSG